MRDFHDAHHILNYKKEWELRPPAKTLRQTHELIPLIDRDRHEYLHLMTPPVPLLGYHALIRTLRAFEPVRGDTVATMDNLMSAIEYAGDHPKAHRIEKSMGALAIEAIDLQRQIIRGNVIGQQRAVTVDLGSYQI